MSNPKMPDLGALMRQAQALQSNVAKAQEEIAKMTVEASAGGGMVTATVNGQFEIVKLVIEKTVVDPTDIGMLQDLVTAAVNQAVLKMRETTKEKMASLMGGLDIPGMPGMF
jgi:nucleoid-associated protein EbfC